MKLRPPYLTYETIGQKAQNFLKKYNPSDEIPVPIEKIVEFDLGIFPVPVPDLYRTFRLNGWLAINMKVIWVDKTQYEEFPEKYYFTLAHEVGHYVLHKDFYQKHFFKTVAEFITWQKSIPLETISWFERHSDWFAGQVLVPTKQLQQICKNIAIKYKEKFKDFELPSDEIWSYFSNEIAEYFAVSPAVVEIRIKNEKIPEKIPLK
jgi:hypothetical protein